MDNGCGYHYALQIFDITMNWQYCNEDWTRLTDERKIKSLQWVQLNVRLNSLHTHLLLEGAVSLVNHFDNLMVTVTAQTIRMIARQEIICK